MYVIVKAEVSKYCAGRQVCHQPTLAPWRQQKAQGAGLGRLREWKLVTQAGLQEICSQLLRKTLSYGGRSKLHSGIRMWGWNLVQVSHAKESVVLCLVVGLLPVLVILQSGTDKQWWSSPGVDGVFCFSKLMPLHSMPAYTFLSRVFLLHSIAGSDAARAACRWWLLCRRLVLESRC